MDKDNLSKLLKENVFRELAARNWSQRDLAKHMKMAHSQLNKYLLGKTAVTLDTVQRFAEAFNTHPLELLRRRPGLLVAADGASDAYLSHDRRDLIRFARTWPDADVARLAGTARAWNVPIAGEKNQGGASSS